MTQSDTDPRPVLLEVRDVVVHYGRIKALHGVSLVVHEGELVTLLGSNGAGKTTMMRAISGLHPLTSGSVWFGGRDVTKVKAYRRVTEGLIQAPEGRGVFPGMSVTENLEMGCYGRKFASKAEHKERLDWVMETFPRLAERRSQVGGTLSGGEQQMLAIGRALMARPKVLLLDEPSMGLAPMVISQIFKIIAEINSQGTTVLLVEQNAQQALSRSDRAYILETGEVTKTGECTRVVGRRQHPRRVPRGGLAGGLALSPASVRVCGRLADEIHEFAHARAPSIDAKRLSLERWPDIRTTRLRGTARCSASKRTTASLASPSTAPSRTETVSSSAGPASTSGPFLLPGFTARR